MTGQSEKCGGALGGWGGTEGTLVLPKEMLLCQFYLNETGRKKSSQIQLERTSFNHEYNGRRQEQCNGNVFLKIIISNIK